MRFVITSVLIFAAGATPAAVQAATQRELAEWVLRWEGNVLLEGSPQPLTDVSQLPAGEVRIRSIDITSGVMRPAELLRLKDLPGLKELYLPGPIWNPGGGNEDKAGVFKALGANTGVQKVAFGWHYNAQMEVADKDVADLFTWTNLQDLRCTQCKLSKLDLSPFTKLRNLDLSYNPFTDAGMAGLAKMKDLKRLLLKDTLVTDEGVRKSGRTGSFRYAGRRPGPGWTSPVEKHETPEFAGGPGYRRVHGDPRRHAAAGSSESVPDPDYELRPGEAPGSEKSDGH